MPSLLTTLISFGGHLLPDGKSHFTLKSSLASSIAGGWVILLAILNANASLKHANLCKVQQDLAVDAKRRTAELAPIDQRPFTL